MAVSAPGPVAPDADGLSVARGVCIFVRRAREGSPHPHGRQGMNAAAMAGAVRSGQSSAAQMVDDALRRIAALDSSLHAFCTLDEAGARAAAERIDRRLARNDPVGPLAGVPVGVKDLICTRDLRTTFGSRLY
ncbi:MAG: hypothetical protein EOO22_15165, partial [Comamonadaceae bacterium]